jgi:hypothetical protein
MVGGRGRGLAGTQSEVPDYAMQRKIFNALIETTAAINASPPGPMRDRALQAAIDALDRFVSK